MKNPASWEKSDLREHLQRALDLELWTIPLYLTALYSIKELTEKKHSEYPDAAKLVFSVVIQEMLHVELVCNLMNAFGFSPKFKFPIYNESKLIPFFHPHKDYLPIALKGYAVKPQALNEESLKLFCAIELPHPKKEIVWQHVLQCDTIAEVYTAISIGVLSLWETSFVGATNNTKQKDTFKDHYNIHGKNHGFSIAITSKESALKAIEAIIEQGEGTDAKHVPADYRPPSPKDEMGYDTAWYKGQLSHYQKFRILLHSYHKLPPVYNEMEEAGSNPSAQENMKKAFLALWETMQVNFNAPGPEMSDIFWSQMHRLPYVIASTWQSGQFPVLNF